VDCVKREHELQTLLDGKGVVDGDVEQGQVYEASGIQVYEASRGVAGGGAGGGAGPRMGECDAGAAASQTSS